MSKGGFKELRVWERAKGLAVSIYKLLSDHGPIRRDFSLADQMRRSAVSIPSNIAEGDERDTDKDAVRHFFIAKSSLAELITQLEIAKDVGLVSGVDIEPIAQECVEVGKMLGALIKARRRFGLKMAVIGVVSGVVGACLWTWLHNL